MKSAWHYMKRLIAPEENFEHIEVNFLQSNKRTSFEGLLSFSKALFHATSARVGFFIAIVVVVSFFIAKSAISAHSESDVAYRQESKFLGAGLSATAQSQESEINPNPPGLTDTIQPVSMSFEVDKITPTPTPAIDPSTNDIWLQLAQCESKQNWSIDTGNGYYGGLQFSLGAWASVGGSGKPSEASKEEQIERGKLLQAKRGWGVWGACAKKLGLS